MLPADLSGPLGIDLLATHASVEVDYTLLPMFRYLLPYAGIGYRGFYGYYDLDDDQQDYYFHGTYWRLGLVLSIGRSLKLSASRDRSLQVYGSEFSAPGWLRITKSKDCFDSWSATQVNVGLLW